jgi:hypothetical protein
MSPPCAFSTGRPTGSGCVTPSDLFSEQELRSWKLALVVQVIKPALQAGCGSPEFGSVVFASVVTPFGIDNA